MLLIHGNDDYTVEVDQSRFMAEALQAANKPHQFVVMPDTDHYFRKKQQMHDLFSSITQFLRAPLAAQ